MSAAMAQLHELFPNQGLVRRIDQWLAEGIDIDADGQFTERSALVYNPITDRALVLLALKLNRPELLASVRRNLDAMLYLLHPGYEVVSEISRRQDANQRGSMASYWFPLAHLARIDQNGHFATLANQFASQAGVDLGPARVPRTRAAGSGRAARSRRLREAFRQRWRNAHPPRPDQHDAARPAQPRVYASSRGGCDSSGAVRVGVFRKGAIHSRRVAQKRRGIFATQAIEGPYFQPFDPPRKVGTEEWEETRRLRRQSEVCRLTQSATVTETSSGFRVRLRSQGTNGVPVAVEINLREGGTLEGCSPAPQVPDGWILDRGQATYRLGGNAIRFGPGVAPHRYTQIRGAEPKLPGPERVHHRVHPVRSHDRLRMELKVLPPYVIEEIWKRTLDSIQRR
jgi:hypothetical protein